MSTGTLHFIFSDDYKMVVNYDRGPEQTDVVWLLITGPKNTWLNISHSENIVLKGMTTLLVKAG